MIFGHSGVKSHNKPWKYGIPILRQLHLVGLLTQDGPEMMISQQLYYGEAILHGAMDPPLTNPGNLWGLHTISSMWKV